MSADEYTHLNRTMRTFPRNLHELAEMVERMKAEAPKIERDETAVVLTAEEYAEWLKSQPEQTLEDVDLGGHC
jgi:argininosuccinate lyase